MAQSSDLVVPNSSGAGVRSAINSRLLALGTGQSGSTAPSTTYPYQFWNDTTAGLAKVRNGANTAWITIGPLDTAGWGLAPTASPTFTGTPAAPTATAGTNTTQLATTAFVQAALGDAKPVQLAAQDTTSGTTAREFTGIPSTAKRITMVFNSVSTNGSNIPLLQIGSGSFTTTGYNYSVGYALNAGTSVGTASSSGSGFVLSGAWTSASVLTGTATLHNISGNLWVFSISATIGSGTAVSGGGYLSLSGALDRVRLSSADTWDLGSVGVMYE